MLMREPTITNKKKDLKKAELFVKSRLLQILLLLSTIQQIGTASPPQHPRIPHPVRTFTPTTRRTAAWPGGEECEKGRRPSQLRVLPLLANYRLPKGRTFIPKIKKIKTYKKRDRQTNKVQQSQKRKKLFLFLHFLIYS